MGGRVDVEEERAVLLSGRQRPWRLGRRLDRELRGEGREPRMVQRLLRRRPYARIVPQQVADEILGARGDGLPPLAVEARGRGDRIGRAAKGEVAGDEDVRRDARRPHVRAAREGLALQHLRRRVEGCALGDGVYGRHAGGRQMDGGAKVGELDDVDAVDARAEEVLRLDVAASERRRERKKSARERVDGSIHHRRF